LYANHPSGTLISSISTIIVRRLYWNQRRRGFNLFSAVVMAITCSRNKHPSTQLAAHPLVAAPELAALAAAAAASAAAAANNKSRRLFLPSVAINVTPVPKPDSSLYQRCSPSLP